STWAMIRNSRPLSKNGSKPSNAASLIGRLLDLAEELVDARAGLDGVVHLEMEMRDDPELQPGRQKGAEVRRGALQRLEDVGLLLPRQRPARDPDLRDGEVAADLDSAHGERAEPRILRAEGQDLPQLDLDPVRDAARAGTLLA